MTKEDRHLLHLARAELNWLSVLANALNTETTREVDWEQAKKEFELRGYSLDNEDIFNLENVGEQKQVDVFGTFANCTLCWNKKNGYFINYGWAIDDYNTDLYEWGIGDMRPYYDKESKREFLER